ncbi:laccase [Artomyces pyxidatus]|uniref:Laccase n=1 Tax=Artomyces pyxidatus TaxID=48021 RepID=A0ACB8T6K2_9AGAM|nr:laccase [Artomyces pyxidatus]
MVQLFPVAFLLAALSSGALASIGPVATIPIVNKVIAPDGFSRDTVLADGTFPGPTISGFKGNTFELNVIDQLKDKNLDTVTSVHWHGLFQHTSNSADGPAFVTQCPIIPGDSFLYKFTVPTQAGTFWYHSHYRNQYCDGLRGAIVVKDPFDPHGSLYDVDDDSTVITLADWYHVLSPAASLVPAFDSVLINGKGRYSGGTDVALSIVNVVHGLRYRLRLVSISCDPSFTFSIDGHQLTIIEVDGQNVQPLVVDNLKIFVGQRYSAVLHANQPVGNYWIRSLPTVTGATTDGGINSAILRYLGAPNKDPTTNSTLNLPLVETNLHPLTNPAAPGKPVPGGADINLTFDVQFTSQLVFQVNGATFNPPSVPVLLQILSGVPPASLLPAGSVYPVQGNKVVELVIPAGAAGGPHPVHLHGHAFSVVRSAGNASYNFVNPVRRDVVSIGDTGDEVTIRWTTDNPGPWFFHCHIDWHLNLGFAAVFAEDVPNVPAADGGVSNAWRQLCPEYNKYMNLTSTNTTSTNQTSS